MNNIEKLARELFPDKGLCRCGGEHKICLNCLECRAKMPDRTVSEAVNIASLIDATVLKADTTSDTVRALCGTARKHNCASVCVNSHFIPLVVSELGSEVKSCTVINFPLGANEIDAVIAEAEAVVALGIDELDMVQNIPAILDAQYELALSLIRQVASLCINRGVLLKVILETCYLTEEQIIISCLLCKAAGAHFVKTSTGFGTSGANPEIVALMRRVVGPKLGVKASGGIKTNEQARKLIQAGANRIGASSVDAIL